MARIYKCDNCGKEVSYLRELHPISTGVYDVEDKPHPWRLLGEYCSECQAKIEERIKAGVN